MASQFDQARVVLQPTQQAEPAQTNVFEYGAQVAASLGSYAMQDASAQGQRSQQLYGQAISTATSGFDRLLAEYNKLAEENAVKDAAGIIQRDGNKQLIAPSSFYPPGISSRAYGETYRKNAEALYRQTAENDYQYYSEVTKQKFPGDTAAYSAAMQTKRQAMLTGLDERFKPYMDIRFEQIEGQAVSQIAVKVQSDRNAYNREISDRSYAGIVADSVKLAGWANGTGAQTEDAANTLIANSSVMQRRLADWEVTARSAGMTQPEIDRKKADIGFAMAVHTGAENIRNQRYDDGQGNVDHKLVADTQASIRIAAQTFGPRAKQVEDQWTQALNYSLTQSGRFAQGQVLADTRAVEGRARQAQSDALTAKAIAPYDPDAALTITQRLETEARAALNDSSLSDAAAMRLAAAYSQTGATSRTALTESYNNRLQSMNAIVNDPTASPEQKSMAYENARAVRNDPETYRELTTGQRQALQSTMDGYVTQNYAAQVSSFNSHILKGETSPAEVAKARAYQVANNMIPPEQIARTGEIDAAAAVAYNNRQTQSKLAAEYIANNEVGKPSTQEQVDAFKKEINFQPAGGKQSVDYKNPEHVEQVGRFYQQYGVLPDKAKAALDAIKISPDEADAAGPKAILERIRQVEREKIEKATGKAADPSQDEMLEGKVAAIVGKNYQYLNIATRANALAAFKVVTDSRSKSGELGQTVDQSKSSLETALRNTEGMLAHTTLNAFTQALSKPLGVLGMLRTGEDAGWLEKKLGLTRDEVDYTADMTPETKAARAVASLTGLDFVDHVGGMTGLSNRGKFERIVIDDNYGKSLVYNAGIHLATDGDAIRTGRPAGSAESFVVNTALFESIRRGEAGVTISPDGKTATIGWKTLGSHVGPMMNMKMTRESEQSLAANVLSAEQWRVNGTLVEVDPTRISTRSYQAPNGQLRFYIAEQDRNGNFVRGMDLAKDDPRIGAQALAVVKSATQAVVANAADKSIYGTAVLMAITGPFAPAALAAELSGTGVPVAWPIKDNHFLAGQAIGGVVQKLQMAVNRPGMSEAILSQGVPLTADQNQARLNMQTFAKQILLDLDNDLKKIKDAPNAREALNHMLERHLPGTENTAMRQLIIDAGFYQPGRLPQVQTGPSRIGKEAR